MNAGPSGGNNTYGLFQFTGAASTVIGNVNNTNYQQFRVTGTTLHLNNFSLTNSWATNVPAFFNIGLGGTVDNTVGNSNLTGHMSVLMNGGNLTNTGGGTFIAPGLITGFGLVSGPMTATGGISANGGTLIVDGTAGAGITAASAGWGTGGAGNTLDLKGNINFAPALSFPAAPALYPSGGVVRLDGANINTPGNNGTIQVNHGTFEVHSGTNSVNGALIPSGSDGTVADYQVDTGATLKLNSANTLVPAVQAGALTLQTGATLSATGPNNVITVRTDYTNADWGSGNSFNPDANVTGAVIDAAGTGPFQTITGSAVTGGASTTPTLALGALHVGNSTSQSFAIMNTGVSDPSLRGAVQTTGITDSRLSGVTAGNFGPIASGASTGPYTVAFNATSAGNLSGQSIAVVSNFANVPTQTVDLTGAAYHYADPVWSQTGGAGSFSGSGNSYTLDFGTLHNGVPATADLQILNQLFGDDPTGAFTDLLDGSFTTNVVKGAAFDLTGFGDFSMLAAGGTVDQTVSYDRHGPPYGIYDEIITFAPTSFDTPLGELDACADHVGGESGRGARGGHHHHDAGRLYRHLPHRTEGSPAEDRDRDGPLTSRRRRLRKEPPHSSPILFVLRSP